MRLPTHLWAGLQPCERCVRRLAAIALVTVCGPSAPPRRCPIRVRCPACRCRRPNCRMARVTVRVVRDQITNNLAGHRRRAARRRRRAARHDRRRRTRAVLGRSRRARRSTPMRVGGRGAPGVAAVRDAGERRHATILRGHERCVADAAGPAPAGRPAPSAGGQPQGAPPQPPCRSLRAARSSLSIGGNSRVATEFSDDVLQMFYLLEIVNRRQHRGDARLRAHLRHAHRWPRARRCSKGPRSRRPRRARASPSRARSRRA